MVVIILETVLAFTTFENPDGFVESSLASETLPRPNSSATHRPFWNSNWFSIVREANLTVISMLFLLVSLIKDWAIAMPTWGNSNWFVTFRMCKHNKPLCCLWFVQLGGLMNRELFIENWSQTKSNTYINVDSICGWFPNKRWTWHRLKIGSKTA